MRQQTRISFRMLVLYALGYVPIFLTLKLLGMAGWWLSATSTFYLAFGFAVVCRELFRKERQVQK